MSKKSAGILLYRFTPSLEIFLVHPGGPFWAKKDEGAWSIPKGEFEEEDPLAAALREFEEETGVALSGDFIPLAPVKLKSGKMVHAFAQENMLQVQNFTSNTCTIIWPPSSGKKMEIPEVDRWEWFDIITARKKINSGSLPLIEELLEIIHYKL
jgi:predicted NUDIX family NTP pyrophosphohydrolase